jgi:transcriptional regulator with XRE-family HTH domain
MSATHKGVSSPTHDLFVDSLDDEIKESLKDPQYRAASEDSLERYDLIDRLVQTRKSRGLTQKQVAERMGVGQSTVAGFENEGSDPRLSTVQRYARAVETRCVVSIQVSVECDWVRTKYEKSARSTSSTGVEVRSPSDKLMAWVANSKRSSFALAA